MCSQAECKRDFVHEWSSCQGFIYLFDLPTTIIFLCQFPSLGSGHMVQSALILPLLSDRDLRKATQNAGKPQHKYNKGCGVFINDYCHPPARVQALMDHLPTHWNSTGRLAHPFVHSALPTQEYPKTIALSYEVACRSLLDHPFIHKSFFFFLEGILEIAFTL